MKKTVIGGVKQGFRVSALALAVHSSFLMVGTFCAQQAFASEQQVNTYNIAAGSLDRVLNSFANQAQIDMSIDGRLTAGKSSDGLSGQYNIEQGLATILKKTNLQVQKNNKGYVLLEKTSAQIQQQSRTNPTNHLTTSNEGHVTALPVIVVTAIDDDPREDSKNNYGVNRSSSATKLDLALKDTPQSITIITQKQIEEQALTDVNKILEATPGVTVQNYGVPGAGRATFYSRGYEINNVMVDGAPTLISGSRGMEILAGMDTVIYDRVEVTRGSTGLSTGTGDPSASINFVRKRPGLEAERSAKISYGRWDKKRVELDVSQPFTSDGSIRGRFVAAYGQGDSYIDRIQEESKIFYGIVEADLGDKTTVALGGTWYDKDVDDASPHMTAGATNAYSSTGIFDGGKRWNAAADWSYSHMRNWNTFLTLNHQFNDHWKLTTNYQYSKNTPDRLWGIVGNEWYNEEYNTANFSIGRENPASKVQNLDITLLGKFDLFGREAQIATGINGYDARQKNPIYETLGGSRVNCTMQYTQYGCAHLDGWNGDVPYPQRQEGSRFARIYGYDTFGTAASINHNKEKQYGYFLSTKLEPLQNLKVILGTRYNHYKIEQEKVLFNGQVADIYSYDWNPKDKWIPYAGLIYNLTENTTAYASYTGIYKTQLEKDINDKFLPFIEGNSYEIGFKSTLFDNRLNLATAIFRMKEDNYPYVMFNVPINPETGQQYRCTPTEGTVCEIKYASEGPTISGFEISAQGSLTPEWLINAGYTYLHIDQVDGDARSASYSMSTGDYSYERPKHAINLSTSYQATEDLTLGGSIRWKYKTVQGISNCRMQGDGTESCTSTKERRENLIGNQGSFTVFDLMARYKINENIIAGLNINNLFDKAYKKNRLSSLYGEPLNVTFSLSTRF
ncbi:TonB-dependent siderophore receptor [Acinetobacter puyangensis]|uniref:Outer-membrane receptor for ferric coprogen and ferric-rhodotorulic acid n=1 Tax=Acinetobacter puyangensis TaxID=1096779 RepID=A0A240ECU9_9GAMM|nr:TonB-dependent receptor [Acinetobacter puyangensis]SNX46381.1 outer-membrane receptor for ferric coprogen and ferric-rhodotorulic acid [Acinetobacter puyangensis]